MVAKTLAEHVALLGSAKIESFKPSTRPQGALMMAISAVSILFCRSHVLLTLWHTFQVLRALFCSVTGEIKESGKETYFSKDNWGDYSVKTGPNTPPTIVPRGTIFKTRISKLTDTEWVDILSTATAFVGKKKKPTMETKVAESSSGSGPVMQMTEEEMKAYDEELYA